MLWQATVGILGMFPASFDVHVLHFITAQDEMFCVGTSFFLHSNCHHEIAKFLMKNMDPSWTDKDGETLLHFACR